MGRYLAAAVGMGVGLALSGPAYGWGQLGHTLIADIAEGRLTPAARAQVIALLAEESNMTLDDVASWADVYRYAHPETAPWHYVDIPLEAPAYDAARDCAREETPGRAPDCIVAQLVRYTRLLGDAKQPSSVRLDALKFVVHFVGDLHQPLHAEDDHDHGGNQIRLRYRDKSSNLHAVWDSGIIETHLGWQLGPNFSFDHSAARGVAATLVQSLPAATVAVWAVPNTVATIDQEAIRWANESHLWAQAAYARRPLLAENDGETAYQNFAWPIVQTQLVKAGVRLAEILNESLP